MTFPNSKPSPSDTREGTLKRRSVWEYYQDCAQLLQKLGPAFVLTAIVALVSIMIILILVKRPPFVVLNTPDGYVLLKCEPLRKSPRHVEKFLALYHERLMNLRPGEFNLSFYEGYVSPVVLKSYSERLQLLVQKNKSVLPIYSIKEIRLSTDLFKGHLVFYLRGEIVTYSPDNPEFRNDLPESVIQKVFLGPVPFSEKNIFGLSYNGVFTPEKNEEKRVLESEWQASIPIQDSQFLRHESPAATAEGRPGEGESKP